MLFRRTGLPPSTPDPSQPPGLPRDLIRKVRRIEISTNRFVDEGLGGEYQSVFKGRGVEFAEVRPYQMGDDIRTIDWNVTARAGRLFVKRYVEERDLNVFLAVDTSGSLNFGSRAILKRELAAEIVALLSFAALRNHDRVGSALISDRMDLFLPPRRRRAQVLRIVWEILRQDGPPRRTDLERSLGAVLATLRQRSVLFLISDFVSAPCSAVLKAAAARHDLVVIEIIDPCDDELPLVGPIVVRDAETGQRGVVDGRRSARAHAAHRQQERQRLHRLIRRLGVDHLELKTDRPYFGALVAFFERRRKRLRR